MAARARAQEALRTVGRLLYEHLDLIGARVRSGLWIAGPATAIALAIGSCGSDGAAHSAPKRKAHSLNSARTEQIEQRIQAACGVGEVANADGERMDDGTKVNFRFTLTCKDGTVRVVDIRNDF